MQGGARPAAPAGRPQVGLRGAGFEFSFEQDAMLKDLARNMRTVSWVLLLVGVLMLVRHGVGLLNALREGAWAAALDPLLALVGAAVFLYCFVSLRTSAGSFEEIVESQGQDQPLLVRALRSLGGMFSVLALVVIAIGVLLVLSVLSAVLFTGGRARTDSAAPAAKPAAPAAAPAAPVPGTPPGTTWPGAAPKG
jgi:hypothetical protein